MQHRRTKLNRWVFKWHLKVRMFSHSRISAGRVPGGCSSNRKSAMGQFGVYARNDEHRSIRASEERRTRGGAWVCTLEWLWSAACESVQPVSD